MLHSLGDGISGSKFQLVAQQRPGFGNVALRIAVGNIDVDVTGQHAVLVANHRRAAAGVNLGEFAQGKLALAR